MSEHLRFTPEEHQAICRACQSLSLTGPISKFQRSLASGLLGTHPVLAAWVAGLREEQVCILLDHLHGPDEETMLSAEGEGQAGCDLSFQEWRAVSGACALISLREESANSFKGRLLQEVAHEQPHLAVKLARLSEGQFAALCQQVKSGRRWQRS